MSWFNRARCFLVRAEGSPRHLRSATQHDEWLEVQSVAMRESLNALVLLLIATLFWHAVFASVYPLLRIRLRGMKSN